MGLSELIKQYKILIEKGESLEAIEKFYDEDIVQIENNSDPVSGKQRLLELEKKNIAGVYSFELRISSMIVDEDLQKVMGEMIVQFDSKKNGKKIIHEAFVQQWRNNKIIQQRFYYGSIEDAK
jgi:hypothetical protein